MVTVRWKALLGARLKEFRERAHGGKGITHEKAAETIKRTKAYVVRLETKMEEENPTINMLEDLVTLYGFTLGDLFEPIVDATVRSKDLDNQQLKEKLDFILQQGPERTRIAIDANIHAMYDMARRLRKSGK